MIKHSSLFLKIAQNLCYVAEYIFSSEISVAAVFRRRFRKDVKIFLTFLIAKRRQGVLNYKTFYCRNFRKSLSVCSGKLFQPSLMYVGEASGLYHKYFTIVIYDSNV
jgi:hypothetical protein